MIYKVLKLVFFTEYDYSCYLRFLNFLFRSLRYLQIRDIFWVGSVKLVRFGLRFAFIYRALEVPKL